MVLNKYSRIYTQDDSLPAVSAEKNQECLDAGAYLRRLLELDLKPRDILVRAAFENALVVVTVLGGSTNAVLHLIAIAHAAGVALSMEDFQAVSNRVPVLADLKPSGRYLMEDLSALGGVPAVMRTLLDAGLLHGDLLTVTGRTLAANLAGVQPLGRSRTCCARSATPSRPTATFRFSTATSPRAARWPKSRAKKACGLKARPMCSTRKKR